MNLGAFLSPYLKCTDLPSPKTLTIESAEVVHFPDDKKPEGRDAILVKFREISQGVTAGKTALRQIIDILGSPETDDWLGKKIVIFADKEVRDPAGKKVGGVRFRAAS